MLSNNKCILVYNIPESEIKELNNNSFNIIKVSEEMGEMTISDILSGLRFETINTNIKSEPLILFNNFSDEEIKLTISSIRKRFNKGIFAVITPSSVNWKFSYLLEHLIEEREWYLNNKKGRT